MNEATSIKYPTPHHSKRLTSRIGRKRPALIDPKAEKIALVLAIEPERQTDLFLTTLVAPHRDAMRPPPNQLFGGVSHRHDRQLSAMSPDPKLIRVQSRNSR